MSEDLASVVFLATEQPAYTACPDFREKRVFGAGEGNRTLVVSLEGFCSTIELHPHFNDLAAIRTSVLQCVLQQYRCGDADGTRKTIWSTMSQIVAVAASDVRSAPDPSVCGSSPPYPQADARYPPPTRRPPALPHDGHAGAQKARTALNRDVVRPSCAPASIGAEYGPQTRWQGHRGSGTDRGESGERHRTARVRAVVGPTRSCRCGHDG